ncbi:MAG TPA: CopD family protein [Gemmataceae bacterium]|nr:CopD family protein [Gemmataceae bacterium]
MSTLLLDAPVAIVHVLASATWLGAMFYSFFVLHPRARIYFQKDNDFESFIATVSHGARWKVLTALALIGLSGVGLMVVRWPTLVTGKWALLVGVKIALFLAAVGLFAHISWRLWPARILASADEVAQFQRRFRRAAAVMMTIATVSMALGVLAHTC